MKSSLPQLKRLDNTSRVKVWSTFEYMILQREEPRSFECYDYTTNKFETEQSKRFGGKGTNIIIVLTYRLYDNR